MMNKKLNLSIALFFVSIASFAQSEKLSYSFSLGEIGYTIYEVKKPTEGTTDTIFYELYRMGNPKVIATEIKSIVDKATLKTLKDGYYKIRPDNIVFYLKPKSGLILKKQYTQNINGLLDLKTSKQAIVIPEAPKPIYESAKVLDTVKPIKPTKYQPGPVPLIGKGRVETAHSEKEPTYNGGSQALYAYVIKKSKIQEIAAKNDVKGIFQAKLFIEIDGTIKDVEINKKLGSGCDEALMKVFKNMPKWNSGFLNGNPARLSYNFILRVN